jgi:uncharacterized protein
MVRQEQIASVIDAQRKFLQDTSAIDREMLVKIPVVESFATIITGIRRCGKSTLLHQVLNQKYEAAIFLNFDDIRLSGFETNDFTRLYNEIVQRNGKVLCFDEIQLVTGWEIFVHQLLREAYTVFVTGSNASLLSREMGTHLTGRNLPIELFPFSYNEFLALKKFERNAASAKEYLVSGGMPEYLKSGEPQILIQLIDDILARDIAIRHSVRNIQVLRQLVVFLLSNTGNLISATKLNGLFGIKSTTTLLEYFNFLQDAYLVEFMPQFNYSLKAQARNPKKVYAMDTGFISEMASLFTENWGQRFENLVYLKLRREYRELFYFKQKGECDFVACKQGKPEKLVQACFQVDDMNFDRELNGLVEAMKYFKLTEGTLVTFNQSDSFDKEGLTIKMIPVHEYLS